MEEIEVLNNYPSESLLRINEAHAKIVNTTREF